MLGLEVQSENNFLMLWDPKGGWVFFGYQSSELD